MPASNFSIIQQGLSQLETGYLWHRVLHSKLTMQWQTAAGLHRPCPDLHIMLLPD